MVRTWYYQLLGDPVAYPIEERPRLLFIAEP